MKVWAQEILNERTELWASKNMAPREPTKAATIREQQNEYYGNGSD